MLFEFILTQIFKTYLFVKTNFYLFQMLVFFTFLNTRIGWGAYNQVVARESPDLSVRPWLLRLQIWCLRKFLSFYGLTKFMLKWIGCGFEEPYDDFCLWVI